MKKEVFVILLGSALLLTLAMTSVSAIEDLPLDRIAQEAINGEAYVAAGQGLEVRSYAEVASGEKGKDAFFFSDVCAICLDNETIQDRINNASQGDTIKISAGTYNENVTVNKTVTLIGTGVEVIGLNPFTVTEAGVKISDFVITGTDYGTSIGILTGANTTIDNCTVTNSKYAIKFGANNCTVKNTLLTDNQYGIYAYKKTNQEIYGNQILNSYEGICLMGGNGTEIYDNVIKNSTAPHGSDIPTGIFLSDTGNLIYSNSFIDNTRQVFVYENRSNTWNTSTIGNLWSDYNGTGYYVIDENNTDYLPRSLSVGFDTEEKATDYSKSEHWLSLPTSVDKEVDVFFLYPTCWQKVNNSNPNICDIDNPSMLIGAKICFYKDATAFETVGNIYAPYYRQVDGAYTASLPSLEEQDKFAGGIPKSDVFAAFDYYIKNYNNGRPFIIAGHSQGSVMARFLLSEYMKENPEVYNRMIAAYVIGYSVTDEYLAKNPHLKFAEGPDDTGVIISYNTEAPTIEGNSPVVFPGAIAINPIIWTREETLATAEQSLGSRVINAQGQAVSIKNYADAQVNKTKGVVITTVDAETLDKTPLLPKGVYHTYDYPFYYYNLRANAENRVKHFLGKNKENATDYSKSEHWLSLPTSVDKEVDVFWISPTAWQKVDDNDSNICNINDPTMLIGTKIAFYKDATAFENVGTIYAPYYRQGDAGYILSMPSIEERDKFVGGIPKSDVFAAFEYYIKNYNNGRPFIIASHSQGTMIARFLLSEYMKENPEVYNRMIAAYIIGYSVTDEYLAENPHLKFAEGPSDTGVIISYNTEAPGVTDNPLVFPGAISINPITWTREETLATAEQSLGSRILNAQLQAVFMKNYADAQVNKTKGTVITTTIDAKTSNTVGTPDGIYHPYDYPFYYYNIRENAENRTKKFLS